MPPCEYCLCCLRFLISPRPVCLSISQILPFCVTQARYGLFSFSYFLKVDLTAFPPLSHHSYSFTSALVIALIPCLPPCIPVSPLFLFPLAPAFSHASRDSFPLSRVTLSVDLNKLYVYFSLLINKLLKKKLIGTG